MAHLPTIHLIHASDAPQHLGKINDILQNLKAENRIGNFSSLNADNDLSPLNEKLEGDDLMLVLLTDQLEPHRERIEKKLNELKDLRPDIKVAEIIVDNLMYDNRFTTFPVDLKPIRNREDMDTAWNSIEHSLKEMFPAKKKKEPVPLKSNWSKYLKYVAFLIALVVAYFIFRGLFEDNNRIAGNCIDPEKVNPDGDCPTIHHPVCGCDGKTYSNACVAANAGLISWEDGACE